MSVQLTYTQRQHLRQLQPQRRNDDGYVQVTVLLLLDKGRTPASITVNLGLEKYLVHEQPGYWGLLTSAQLAHLCREVNQSLYTDCAAPRCWRGCKTATLAPAYLLFQA